MIREAADEIIGGLERMMKQVVLCKVYLVSEPSSVEVFSQTPSRKVPPLGFLLFESFPVQLLD